MTRQEVLTLDRHEYQKKEEQRKRKEEKKSSQEVLQRSTSSFCCILAGSNLLNLCLHQSEPRTILPC